ncbi:MAG: hypothetical protein KIT36_02885, partial [Alphaproteobacteria bacterium]|nr:hypothetical protein [Alphaproteobacteria bacterium]
LALLTLSLFVPEQFYVDVGSFRLTAYRVVLFLVFPSIVARLLGGSFRLKAYDLAIFLLGAWMIVAMSVNHGIGQGLESGGILAFEAIAGYLAARLCLTNRGEVVLFVRFLLLCLCLAAVVLLIEIAAGRRLVHELSFLLSGNTAGVGIGAHARFGLVRVSGPFAHPIHAGVFMTVILSFAWLTAGQPARRLFQTGLLAAGTLATLSSAPLIGGLLQAGGDAG